jgi:hypothetical protein
MFLCLVKQYAMQHEGITPLFLISTLDGGELHAPAALLPKIKPPVPFGYEPQCWFGRCGEQKNLALPGINSGASSSFPVAVP